MTTTKGGGFRILHLEGAMVLIWSNNLPSVTSVLSLRCYHFSYFLLPSSSNPTVLTR